MTTARVPVDELRELAGADRFRPGYAVATVIAWILAAIGWLAGRTLVILGWLAGRTWLTLAYMAEAVIYGFRSGAGLPPKGTPPATAAQAPPAR